MGSFNHTIPITPYSRPSEAQAAADAIPILIDDTYHVFHLSTPPHTRHHPPRLRSSWTRMRSRNLVDWARDDTPVLEPGKKTSDPDADGVWTGCAVLDLDGNMNIFYTGYNLAQDGKQVILRTKSKDRHGTSFEGPAKVIAIENDGLAQFEEIDFRDPYIFYNKEESQYWMLVATRLSQGPHWVRGCIALLTSTDLDSWTVAPEPLYYPNDMFCPECPELFSLPNGKWYLVYSRFHAPNAGTVYRVADSPRGPFRIPRDGSHGRLDGRRWYAAKSCPKAGDPSKRIYFGWLGDYVDEEKKWLWGGDLGVPREVSADERGYLRVDAAPEFRERLNQTSRPFPQSPHRPDLHLSSIGSVGTYFPELGPPGTRFDISLTFKVSECDAHSFGIVLDADNTDNGHDLTFIPSGDGRFSVVLTTHRIPLDDFWADQYKLHVTRPVDGPELVRHDGISLDDGVLLLMRDRLLEIFCGGRSMSYRLPLPPSSILAKDVKPLGWFVDDGTVEITDVSVRDCSVQCEKI